MTWALFPTGVQMQFATGELRRIYSQIRSSEESPTVGVLSRWPTAKVRGCECRFLCDATDLASIRSCWESSMGGSTPVDFRWPWPDPHFRLWVAEFYVANLPIDLPVYGGSSHSLINLTTGATIGGCTFVSGGGANDRDRLTAIAVPPTDGTPIGLNVTGYLQLAVRLSGVWNPVEIGAASWMVPLIVDEV
jgi:hypothetical protein